MKMLHPKPYINSLRSAAIAIAITSFTCLRAAAVSITFDSADLADLNSGQDLRQAILNVTDGAFTAGEGFSVFFPATLFSTFSDAATSNSGWDLLPVEPDLGDDGFLDGLSVTVLATVETSSPFTLSFVYSGVGPLTGVYPFHKYILDPFEIIEKGYTTPANVPAAVPETLPAGWALASVFGTLFLLRKAIGGRRCPQRLSAPSGSDSRLADPEPKGVASIIDNDQALMTKE